MKDSGIQWIGQIPENWRIERFKFTHQNSNVGESIDKNFCSERDGKLLFYTAGLEPITTNYSNFPCWKYTKERDLLLARNGTPYVYLPKEKAVYSDHIIRVTINDNYSKRFIRYCLQQAIKNEVVDTVSITTWSVPIWDSQYLSLPSIEQQKRIADFLDQKTTEIQFAIDNTKQTIEEYKKLKQAVITKAVTKGLEPNRKMKDSGSVWFGEVPADWDVKKLKFVFYIKKDIAGKEGYDVLSITQRGIVVKNINKNEGQLAADYSNYQLVNIGDFAMNHMDLLTGWVDISKYAGVTSPDYRVFQLQNIEENCPRYFLYMMQMCYMDRIFYGLGQGVSGMGRWRLQADKFLNFLITVPSKDEQEKIAEYLDRKCSQIDTLISQKEQFITELEKYKQSLIYEYVTGKKQL